MSLSPSKPAGALRRAFLLRPDLASFGVALAQDVRGRSFDGTLGLGDCAVSATIGLTGVKRVAIGCSAISNSIRARRTSDICLGRRLTRRSRLRRESGPRHVGSRTNPIVPATRIVALRTAEPSELLRVQTCFLCCA